MKYKVPRISRRACVKPRTSYSIGPSGQLVSRAEILSWYLTNT